MSDLMPEIKRGDTVRYREGDWANRAPMTVLWVSSIHPDSCLLRWPDGSEHAASIAKLERENAGDA